MDFEYSSEWYGSIIDDEWKAMGGDRTTPEGLKQWYDSSHNKGPEGRFMNWFADIHLAGKGIELGFQCGKTAHWICKRFPGVVLDVLDWNDKLRFLEAPMRKLANIDQFYICDCREVGRPDGYYDFITSLDFYEHLTKEVYFSSISECFRLLKPGGLFFVYLGTMKHPAHINCMPVEQQVRDVVSKGFELVSQKKSGNYTMSVFRKP